MTIYETEPEMYTEVREAVLAWDVHLLYKNYVRTHQTGLVSTTVLTSFHIVSVHPTKRIKNLASSCPSNKVIIVTEAIVLHLLSKDVSVVGVDLNKDGLQKLIDELIPGGPAILLLRPSSKMLSARAIFSGTLVALVNNAGIVQPIESPSCVLNVVAPLALIQKTLPYLRAINGRIINISSDASRYPLVNHAAYGATKAALSYITSVLAIEEPDITTIAFHPGVVDTPLCSAMEDEFQKVGERAKASADFIASMKIGAEVPGGIIGNLAIGAEHSLSGRYIAYNHDDLAKYA
ncbi:NAD(P)-binding protein [Linderina pennispora]|uniref:NAD(P)-binding protein n=1 Tax=Linderina pennispora TaxID=61395 RepID=A0A1Y1WD75_9FUNG|nr:NAD(P)-binding protein [Linderina pennispora]ORX71483.1 NAD(P)-binding protein [Linderina pennispora]